MVATICIALAFFIEIGDYMLRAPLMRIFEGIICRSYYESITPSGKELSIPIPEEKCKIPFVQSELAMLKGWEMTFSCIPGILAAVPFGMVADRYGRKLVLLLALLGVILCLLWTMVVIYYEEILDLRWYWAGNAFLFIGGGSSVVTAMIFAILSDVASEEQRAAIFFRFGAAALISTVVGIPFSWYLMKKNLWVTMWISIGFVVFGASLALFLPETLERAKVADFAPEIISEEETEQAEERPTSSHQKSLKRKLAKLFDRVQGSHFIFESPMLFGLSIVFLLQRLSGNILNLMVQLASERFHWGLGDASFIIPIYSIAVFLVLIIALPSVYHVLSTRFRMSSMRKDLIVARGSQLTFILGSLGIALGFVPALFIAGTIVFACGAGFPAAARSLITSLVHPDEVSRLYAFLAVIETIGQLIYGLLLSKAFGWGLNLGGLWSGMAFLACALLFAVVGSPIWLVREPTPEMDVHN
ncbi:MFS general substrate transporter [Stipitochalara longipes BDJ]|nr:MFS general substrate transporter [Stipitochalara longipes BDJ]